MYVHLFFLSKSSAAPRLFMFLPQKEQNCALLMMRFINDSDPMAAGNWKDGGMEMTKREVEKNRVSERGV